MNAYIRRSNPRHYDKAPILLQTKCDYSSYKKDYFYYTCAKMQNYSCEGMYFESDYVLQPGSKVIIEMADDSIKRLCSVFCAEVKWCKKIAGLDSTHYGVGIQF